MKSKIATITLSLISSVNLFALDINEAIDIAVKNNFELKKEHYVLDETKANLDGAYSAYKPKVDIGYTYNNRDKLISSQIKKDSTLSTSVSYNLFNGFSDKYGIDSSKNIFDSSKFTYEAKKYDLILEVKNSYINYLLKKKQTLTFSEALKLYEKQYIDSKNFYEKGLIAQNELLEVEVEMLQAKQNFQSAKANQKIFKQKLENILGKPISEEEYIEELSNVTQEEFSYDESKLLNRAELKALDLLASSYQATSKATKGNFYPQVDASVSYNKYGDDLMPTSRAGYPDSQSITTLSLHWNLYNGDKDKSTEIAYIKKAKQVSMQIEDLKLQIKLQYQNAKEQYDVAILNLATAKKALEVSKLNYEILSNKVKEGISSNKDLIDANYLLTKSKQNYFSAYYSKYIAISTLKRVFQED